MQKISTILSRGFFLWLVLSSLGAAEQLQLESDSFAYDTKNNKSIYRGSVVITQGHLRLTGEVVEVFSVKDRITHMVAKGAPSTLQNRDPKNEISFMASATTITYNMEKGQVHLLGGARIISPKRNLYSHSIIYVPKTDSLVAQGNKKRRVRLLIDQNEVPSAP